MKSVWTGRKSILVPERSKNIDQLQAALRANAYIRVSRDEVGGWPNKGLITSNLALNGALTTYKRMESNFIAWIAEHKGAKAAERASRAEALVQLGALWQAAGIAKVEAVTDYAEGLISQGEQVVVFAHHSEVIGAITSALEANGRHVGNIIGGMNSDRKANIIANFQAGKLDAIVANHVAGGEGITLDKAANLIMAQLPWSPGLFVQASDRIYRITQTRNCLIHVLNAAETVDTTMWDVLNDKASVVDQINGAARGISIPDEQTGAEERSVQAAVLAKYGWED
jgi:SNF2 family DNA or RNA helicase